MCTSNQLRAFIVGLALVAGGCGDLTWGEGGGGGGGGTLGSLSQFTWERHDAYCGGNVACNSQLTVTGGGAMTLVVDGSTRSGVMGGNDYMRFSSVVASPAARAALSDPAPCPPLSGIVIIVRLELIGVDGAAKEIAGCTDVLGTSTNATLQAIQSEVMRVRAEYFP